MGKLGDINIETDLITVSKIRCMNFKCVYNLATYPGGWASCNLKNVEIGEDGMCENKQERQKMGPSTSG